MTFFNLFYFLILPFFINFSKFSPHVSDIQNKLNTALFSISQHIWCVCFLDVRSSDDISSGTNLWLEVIRKTLTDLN